MLDDVRASKCVNGTMRVFARTLGPEPLLEDVLQAAGWFITVLFSQLPLAKQRPALEDWIAVLRSQFEENGLLQ